MEEKETNSNVYLHASFHQKFKMIVASPCFVTKNRGRKKKERQENANKAHQIQNGSV